MATRRRTGTRKRSSRKIPPWALAVGGLTVGLSVAWGVHLYLERTDARNPPLPRTQTPAESVQTDPKVERPAKQRFDFYTILPEIESVVPEKERKRRLEKTTTKTEEGIRYVLQAASYASASDADQLRAKLALNGLEARIEKVTIEGKGDLYRVRLGPYKRLQETDAPSQQLAQIGIKALLIKVKKTPGA